MVCQLHKGCRSGCNKLWDNYRKASGSVAYSMSRLRARTVPVWCPKGSVYHCTAVVSDCHRALEWLTWASRMGLALQCRRGRQWHPWARRTTLTRSVLAVLHRQVLVRLVLVGLRRPVWASAPLA